MSTLSSIVVSRQSVPWRLQLVGRQRGTLWCCTRASSSLLSTTLCLWSIGRTWWTNWNDCKTRVSTSLLSALGQLQSMSSNIWLESPPSMHDRNLHKLTCKALQESRHGLRGVISNELTALRSAQQNTPALRHLIPRNRKAELLRRLRRKPWISHALSATFKLSGIHYLFHTPAWIPPELHDEEPTIIINLNREWRAWPPAAANSAFSQLLSDIISGTGSILVATDGSFEPATNRAGWGFAIFCNG